MFSNIKFESIIWLLAFLMFDLTFSQVPFTGVCPDDVKTIQNFNIDEYTGKWYEYSKYPFYPEVGGTCNYAIYKKLNSSMISVLNTQIKEGKRSSTIGTAETTNEPGKLLVKFPNTNYTKPNYWVLGTDYITYAVVYNCNNKAESLQHTITAWILTRSRTPSENSIETAKNIFESNKISQVFLEKSSQSNCPKDDDDI